VERMKRIAHRPLVNPWYNTFVEKAIVDREIAFRFWRSYRTLELQEIYKSCRNRVHCLMR
jgi:hypothetical protein